MPHFDSQLAVKLNDMGLSPEQITEVFENMDNQENLAADDQALRRRQQDNAEKDQDEFEALKQAQADAIERGDLRGAMRAAVGQLQFVRRHPDTGRQRGGSDGGGANTQF